MASLQPYITSLLKSLPPPPVGQDTLDELVSRALADSKDKSSLENRKSQWEYLLKNEIFLLAETEGMALQNKEETKYYDKLRDRLDLVLTFTTHDACEPTFPFIVLQDLLEMQTIASCSHIFSWIEARAERLTEGLVPQKGKALILLRTLNDLLRRLSKMGSTTIFCGRILTFLSAVFPLGERSGVNLRGEYGPTWEGVKFQEKQKIDNDTDMKDETAASQGSRENTIAAGDQMQVDSKKTPVPQSQTEKKEDFYNTFWSLQLPFSKPTIFASKAAFEEFKEAVSKVMPFIKEATAKERAMMGSRSSAGVAATLKRKREPEEETNSNEYFFAKFLTSPDLLDLEIADTQFRRQFLFQLLILLNHLLSFTKATKAAWSTPRNRSLQMEFTLEDQDTQWVQETLTKVVEELRQTTPNGRTFADTVTVILEREKNWVKWKNELCTPFDKAPWSQDVDDRKVGFLEATQDIRERLRESPPDWKWKLGTESLTEIWEMGYTDLRDLQNPFQPGDVKDFVKKIKLEDGKIALRKRRLDKISALAKAKVAAANPPPPPPTIVVTPDVSSVTKVESLVPRPDPTPSTLTAPRPSTGLTNSPLHPSLPPKPGSPSKLVTLSPEPPKIVPTTAIVASTPPAPIPAATPAPLTTSSVDDEIAKFEDNKQRWAWLALRTARDQYLQYFGKIGSGDIELLAQEIENGKTLKSDDMMNGTAEDHGSGSPSTISMTIEGSEGGNKDGEDVKMEDR